MVICLERGADLHMAQLIPLPLTVSCFSKIQIGFIFLVPAHPGSPGKRAVKRVCVCVCVCVLLLVRPGGTALGFAMHLVTGNVLTVCVACSKVTVTRMSKLHRDPRGLTTSALSMVRPLQGSKSTLSMVQP